MTDSSWNNETPSPPGGRGPAWGKLLAGCGIAAVVGISLAVVGGISFVNRKMNDPEVRQEMGHALWPLLRRTVEDLGTDEGARDLYSRQRGLREQYPSEAAFLAAVQGWRPSLAGFPAEMPGPEALETHVTFEGMRLVVRLPDGKHLVVLAQGRGRRALPIKQLEVR